MYPSPPPPAHLVQLPEARGKMYVVGWYASMPTYHVRRDKVTAPGGPMNKMTRREFIAAARGTRVHGAAGESSPPSTTNKDTSPTVSRPTSTCRWSPSDRKAGLLGAGTPPSPPPQSAPRENTNWPPPNPILSLSWSWRHPPLTYPTPPRPSGGAWEEARILSSELSEVASAVHNRGRDCYVTCTRY